MEIIELIFEPVTWAFSKFVSDKINFDGIPFWVILVAIICLGILIANIIPLAFNIGRNLPEDSEKR